MFTKNTFLGGFHNEALSLLLGGIGLILAISGARCGNVLASLPLANLVNNNPGAKIGDANISDIQSSDLYAVPEPSTYLLLGMYFAFRRRPGRWSLSSHPKAKHP